MTRQYVHAKAYRFGSSSADVGGFLTLLWAQLLLYPD
jgi:hypothetical protein